MMDEEQKREDLLETIADLEEMIHEFEIRRDQAIQAIEPMTALILSSGRTDMKKFIEIRDSLDYSKTVLAELGKKHRQAQLELWQFDLQAKIDELKKAIKAATDARLNILQTQTDKTNYLRAAREDTPEQKKDRITNFDILLVDARSQAHTAETHREKVRAELEYMQASYNEIAMEAGWKLEPVNLQPGSVPSI
jgi:hypothetical protein